MATVKVNVTGSGESRTQLARDRFLATNVTLKYLLQNLAFDISGPRIAGGPKWLDSEHFDVEAKMDPALADQLRGEDRSQEKLLREAMFQQLFAERFRLKTHWEDRPLAIYALSVAKGGPKLQPVKHPERGMGTSSGNGQLQGNDVTLEQFAEMLTQEVSEELGRVVVDRTGVAGTYDVMLKWTPDTGADATAGRNGRSASAGPSIFAAIQEQLGLKLEPAKGPVRVLVIDQAELPSEN